MARGTRLTPAADRLSPPLRTGRPGKARGSAAGGPVTPAGSAVGKEAPVNTA